MFIQRSIKSFLLYRKKFYEKAIKIWNRHEREIKNNKFLIKGLMLQKKFFKISDETKVKYLREYINKNLQKYAKEYQFYKQTMHNYTSRESFF